MNKIVNNFLLAGNKFLHPNTDLLKVLADHSKKRKNTKFKETGDSWYIYQNELNKACFEDGMAWDFKDLPRRTASDNVLREKAFNTEKI